MESFRFLFWAYTVVWIGLAIFLGTTWARLRRAERRLDRLEGGER